MSRTSKAMLGLILGLALLPGTSVAAQQAAAPAAPVAATAADAAPFVGDWNLTLEGPNGPAAIALSVKTDAGKVLGEISSDMMPKTPISDIKKAGQSLVLKYSFDFQGNAVPVEVTLTPAADKVGAVMSFADGMFMMNGTATKAAAK